MTLVYLFLTGGIIGLVSSFLGIGGGSIIVPVLFSLMPELSPTEVISISLFVIYNITLINNVIFHLQKLTPKGAQFLSLVGSCAIGGLLGGLLVQSLPGYTVKVIFTSLLTIVLLKTTFTRMKSNYTELPEPGLNLNLKLAITGLSGGFISGLTGVGGGIIFIPMFMFLCKLPAKYISPYSNIAMCSAAIMGLIPHLLKGDSQINFETGVIGELNLYIGLVLVFGSVLTSYFGAKWNSSIDAIVKRRILIGILFILVTKMIYSLVV